MSKSKILAGTTSFIADIFVEDSSSTVGAGLGSLVYNTSGLAAKYKRRGESSWTTISLVNATAGSYTSGGFIGAGSAPTGAYELHIPNEALASGATGVVIMVYGAANMVPVRLEYELDAVNYQDATRLGLSALPNAAAEASGGLITRGTGNGQLSVSGGRADADVLRVAGTVQTAGDLAALINTVDDYLDTEIAAIKAKTDGLPADPADASDIAASFSSISATLTTIASYIDTEVAAILAAVDTEVAAIKAKTDNLPTDPADQSAVEAAITAATSPLATAAKMLAYARSLARKDVTADADIGGAFASSSDSLEAIRDRGDAAWTTGGGGGGGGTTIFAPVLTELLSRIQNFNATLYVGDTAPVTLAVYQRNDSGVYVPVDLTTFGAMTLYIEDGRNGEVQTVTGAEAGIDGSDNNLLEFTPDAQTTGSVRQLKVALRKDSNGQVISTGTFDVQYQPKA